MDARGEVWTHPAWKFPFPPPSCYSTLQMRATSAQPSAKTKPNLPFFGKVNGHVTPNQHKRSPLGNISKAVIFHLLHGPMRRFAGTFFIIKVLMETVHELLCCCVIQNPRCSQHWASTGSQEFSGDSHNSFRSGLSTPTVTAAKCNQLSSHLNFGNVSHRQKVVFFLCNPSTFRCTIRGESNFSTLGTTMCSKDDQANCIYYLKYRMFCCVLSKQRPSSCPPIFTSSLAKSSSVIFLRLPMYITKPTSGSPTISALVWLW